MYSSRADRDFSALRRPLREADELFVATAMASGHAAELDEPLCALANARKAMHFRLIPKHTGLTL